MKGTIVKRGRSSWRLKFDLPPGPDGRRRTQFVTVRGGKKDAQAKLAELVASVGKGTFVAQSSLTVADHVRGRIDVWHAAGDIGDATRERYNVLLKKQIAPHIGGVAMQRLGTADVERWHGTLRSAGLSPRTISHAHKLVTKALGDAVRHGLLTRNVCGRDGQRAPRVPGKEMQILTADQIGGVVDKLRGHPLFAKAMLALFCGLRAGEVLALRWKTSDLDGKVLYVRESVEEVAGEPLTIKRPKTAAGVRKVSMPEIVVDALREHRRQQLELRMAMGLGKLPEDALVFAGLDGGLSIEWGEAVEALGLPDVTYHALRHSHASQLIAAKVDVVTVSKRLGHANPAITLKVYAHLFEQNDGAAADAINLALGASSVPKTG
jgi:integrase